MYGDPPAEKTNNHVALNISDLDFDNYVKRVRSLSLELFEGRNRISGEGKFLYFSNYDNHLFELHTGTLEQRPEFYVLGSTI
jgi:hypothetical protein